MAYFVHFTDTTVIFPLRKYSPSNRYITTWPSTYGQQQHGLKARNQSALLVLVQRILTSVASMWHRRRSFSNESSHSLGSGMKLACSQKQRIRAKTVVNRDQRQAIRL